jgi:hypothetical protein
MKPNKTVKKGDNETRVECPCGSIYHCKGDGELKHFNTNKHTKWVALNGKVASCKSYTIKKRKKLSPTKEINTPTPISNEVLVVENNISTLTNENNNPLPTPKILPDKQYESKTVLEFIQNDIRNNDDLKTGILDKIIYKEQKEENNEDRSSQGFYYERLWDICIKFGVTNLTLPSLQGKLQTSHIINENTNKSDINFIENCWKGDKLNGSPGGYLNQPIRSGSSGGYSDITFVNKSRDEDNKEIGEELILISVKFFRDEKGIGDYDLGKLCALIRKHETNNRSIKLCIFVNSKTKAIAKFKSQNLSSNILIKYINPHGNYENIYDILDLNESYFKLKKLLEQYNYLQTSEDIKKFEENYLYVLKSIFIPRFHQKLFTNKISELIENGEKKLLIGSVPRSGKSYIMAGSIIDYIRNGIKKDKNKRFKFIMMTPAPNETFTEYNDIFKNYVEFSDLGVDIITYTDEIKLKDVCRDKNKHCIIIISKQKLGWTKPKGTGNNLKNSEFKTDDDEDHHEDEDDKKNEGKEVDNIKKRIKKLIGEKNDIDMMFLDEAHFGMSTDKAMRIVEILDDTIKETIKVFVTATYNKPLNVYGIKPECKITWDMNDIKIMQNLNKETINDNNIRKRFGIKNYTETLKYFGDENGTNIMEKLKKEYSVYPKPFLITSMWDKEFLNAEKLKIGDSEFGWDMSKLFATDGGTFVNNEQIKELMRYYFGYPDKTENYNKQAFYRTRGIIPRIKNICVNKCRTLQNRHKTSQLWFLPVGNGKIKDKVKAIITLLTQSNEFNDIKDNYHFFTAVDIEDNSKKGQTMGNVTYMGEPGNIKSDIESCEKKIKEGKLKGDNLIILSGNRLQLGISLRNVDIVTLWNSTTSSDALFQMLFRSMTEVDSKPCDGTDYCQNKRFGFMIDMNPQRALTNVNLFSDNITNEKSDESDTKKWKQITDMINIDEDVFQDKYEGDESKKDEFVTELFNKLYASWDINVENVKKVIRGFSFDEDELEGLKSKFENMNIEKNKTERNIIQDVNEDEIFPTGKKIQEVEQGKKDNETIENDKIEESKTLKPEVLNTDSKKKKKEINIREVVIETLSEVISLLNIFTLYEDGSSGCVLTKNPIKEQTTIISDIVILKNKVFEDNIQKEIFMTILNGRLTGGKETFSEELLNSTLNAVKKTGDKQAINKIVLSQKKKYYTINEPDQLLEFINENLKPKDKEKKENGEVFTPISLVNEMLDKLDESYEKEHKKSIFTDGSLKWFDPASGIGNFPIIVYMRLMIGLKSSFGDEEKRRKHILENMLYMSELTVKNVFISKKIFCGDKYNLRLYRGDSLKLDTLKEWGVEKFDVVMGNPPYNSGGIKAKTTENINHANIMEGEGPKTIWPDFVKMSIGLLRNEKSYLLFINPASWIGFKGKIGNLIKSRQIIYIRYYNYAKAYELFGKSSGKIPVTYYILKNSQTENNTLIYDNSIEKNVVFNIYKYNFIPTESVILWKKILEFTKLKGNIQSKYRSVRNANNLKDIKTNSHKFPIISIVNKGIKVEYTKVNNNYNNEKKLLLANSSMGYPIYDKSGVLYPKSADQFIIYSNDNERELKQLQNYFYTNLIFYLINIIKTRQNFFDNKFFEVIPDITKLTEKNDIDDKFLISLFNLNENELKGYYNFIEKGEGKLEPQVIKDFKNFDLDISDKEISEILKDDKILIKGGNRTRNMKIYKFNGRRTRNKQKRKKTERKYSTHLKVKNNKITRKIV